MGTNQADDSAVLRLSDDTALVLTLDFFPAIVDDPYTFGQIAAANALSDVYAMGGRPIAALNIVCFPHDTLPLEVLGEMLRGGADKVNEAGAVVVGGHTIRDSELKYGLSVTGLVRPDRILRKGGAQNGDLLILTKPLGTGIYSTALKNEALPKALERRLYETMSSLNRASAEVFSEHGAHACTDITGFGFLGHSLEVASASNVSFIIEASRIPLLPEVLDFAAKGYLTGGGMSNLEYVKRDVEFAKGVSNELVMLLSDPQTSGGLLSAIPSKKARHCLEALAKRGVAEAAIVGEVTATAQTKILVSP